MDKVTIVIYHQSNGSPLEVNLRFRQSSMTWVKRFSKKSSIRIQDYLDEHGGLKGVFTISAEQQQYELFNHWLQASGQIKAPLSVPAALTTLRLLAAGVDSCCWDDPSSLKAELEKRDSLSSESSDNEPVIAFDNESLQVRLADVVSVEMQQNLSGDVAKVCKSLVTLVARGFRRLLHVSPTSFWKLDAVSMSQVMAHDLLDVDSESTVLDVVTKWAVHPGRSIEMVNKVMPLVRFPLVTSLITPSLELKQLKKKSRVVKELWQEAIMLQGQQGGGGGNAFSGTKHPLISGVLEGDLEVPRNKRRRLCKDDEVPHINLIEVLERVVF